MRKLHDYLSSGNGYKVRLLLTQLGIPFERIEHDILQGETSPTRFSSIWLRAPLSYPTTTWPGRRFSNGCFLSSTAMSPILPRRVFG